MRVKLIVDSTVDLPQTYREKVITVPLSVLFGETEYLDGVTITPWGFYEMLVQSEQLPTTSQPTPAAFEEVYRDALKEADEVLVITVSSRLSGTYQSATIAAEEFPGKVFVLDSRSAAIGAGILLEEAVALAEQGMGAEQMLHELMEKRKQLRVYAIVDTLEYLKKGGRLSSTVAFVGGVLNLKPIICIEDGAISVVGKARGQKAAFAALTRECERIGVDDSRPLMLGYTGTGDENLRRYLEESNALWGSEPQTSIVGAAIGVHAGPGAVAVAFFGK